MDEAEVARSGRNDIRALRATRWIYVGTTVAVLGIALSLSQLKDTAATITLGGFAVSLVGLHRFGRSGPAQFKSVK